MQIFLFAGSRRGYAVLKRLVAENAQIIGLLCLVEDPHEQQFHLQITAIAKEKSIPIFYTHEVKPAQYAEILAKLKPDIAFAIGWRYLINAAAYKIPPQGTWVIHDSLLPKYRGFAPMNWAIINGETETGVTLFHMAEGVDSGDIVDQLATPITLADTAHSVDERIINLYEEIIIKNLRGLADGSLKAKPQNESRATYTCKRIPEDGEINWQHSALQIHNLIRGLSHPFPGAHTRLQNKPVLIWEAELPTEQDNYVGSIPGRVIKKVDGKIAVLTGQGTILLKRLQFVGETEQDAGAIAVGVKDTFGR